MLVIQKGSAGRVEQDPPPPNLSVLRTLTDRLGRGGPGGAVSNWPGYYG